MELIRSFLWICVIISMLFMPIAVAARTGLILLGGKKEIRELGLSFMEAAMWMAGGLFLVLVEKDGERLIVMWLFALAAVIILYRGVIYNTFFIYVQLFGIIPANGSYDYVVVHGSISPKNRKLSQDTVKRLNKGIEVYLRNPKCNKFILLGTGNSVFEQVEAWEMEEYLYCNQVSEGIVTAFIGGDTQEQNMERLKTFIEHGMGEARGIFITENERMFPVYQTAKNAGLKGLRFCSCMCASGYRDWFLQEYRMVRQKYEWLITLVIIIWLTVASYSMLPF